MTHVCLVAEGSYPYVTGGVGKWTHDLIAALPEVEFTVVALWPSPESTGPLKYPRLPNVRDLRHVYILSGGLEDPPANPGTYRAVERFHDEIKRGNCFPSRDVLDRHGYGRFFKDPQSWELLCRFYRTFGRDGVSFPDYFWTWRATHQPLFRVLEAELPECDVVHSISTGYAGLAGAVHRVRSRVPLLLTEHGLYTRERAQEIADAEWIPGEREAEARGVANLFKEWWNRMFRAMEALTYYYSDVAVTLFEDNRRYQVERGAPAERTRVIPNGVDLALFDAVREKRRPKASDRLRIGLVGRVVPIKDIKTFISACALLVRELGGAPVEIAVVGPTEEDELYAAQCREMVELLGLSGVVTFTGKTDSRKYYEVLDVSVLTSLSEGQPLAVLEAMACGIPVVATDVGSCRELLEGRGPEDRAIGPAGLVTQVADPQDTARAILRLARDPELRRRMAESGRRRVETYYRLDQVRTAYLELYASTARAGGGGGMKSRIVSGEAGPWRE
jgi:glycosyltransferase involved in cell wall biosynthesis